MICLFSGYDLHSLMLSAGPFFRLHGIFQDLVLQRRERVSSERVQRRDRHEDVSPRLYLQSPESKEGVSGLSQALADLVFIHGPFLCLLYQVSLNLHADHIPASVRILCRRFHQGCLPGREHSLSGDADPGKFFQIFLLDLFEKLIVCAGIARLFNGQKIFAVSLIVITCAQSRPYIQGPESLHILGRHLPGLFPACLVPFDEVVNVLSVERRDACRVVRALHSSLDLEGVDPGVDQVRKDLQHAHIPHGKRIRHLLALLKAHVLSVAVNDLVREPACSGAPSAVSAPASQKAGQQAPSRIGIAHSAVDKTLHVYGLLPLDRADLF